MKRLSFFAIILFGVTTGARADLSENAVREVEFNGCRFKISNLHGGELRVSRYSPPKMAFYRFNSNPYTPHTTETSIEFYCDSSKGGKAFSDMGLGRHNGTWYLIPNKSDPGNLLNQKLYVLDNNGLEGAAATDDQTTGDEERRVQGIGFCLTNQKQILCGTSQAVGYVAYPQQSSLPKVLELLKSIKFLEPTE
ncbi:hypothetical protein ACAW63_02335 [Pseudomonas sp. QE6]|uniref:hypothetical protein n=1 Tax=Pseudomonas sp. QE6 TaxID=3242491 RepID=UPI003528F003